MPDLQKANALLIKIEHASGFPLNDAIKELLNMPVSKHRLVELVEKKIDEGNYVLDEHLARLIADTHSTKLYYKASESFRNNVWSLITLYDSRFPDDKIEKTLLDELYRIARNDGEPLRRYIVDALRKNGSHKVIPTLEAIVHDLGPGAKINHTFGESLGVIEAMSARSRYEFVEDVSSAIIEIRERADSNPLAEVKRSSEKKVDVKMMNISRNVYQAKTEAERNLGSSPTSVIASVRKGAEALAKDIYRYIGLEEQSRRPAKKMMLDDLIVQLKQAKGTPAPDYLLVFLSTFQIFGNFAAHDQDGDEEHISEETSAAIYKLYCECISLYEKWRKAV